MKDKNKEFSFSSIFPRIKNTQKRIKKAEKVRYIIENYTNMDLKNSICIDVGCSTGSITYQLANLFKTIIGIDFDIEALMYGKKQNLDYFNTLELINADGLVLPIKSESVDILLCTQVYEHVPDDYKLVEELYRILKPNGVIFFSGPNKLFPLELHYNLPFIHWLPVEWQRNLLPRIRKGPVLYERIRNKNELLQMLRQFQIQDISIEVALFYLQANKFIRTILKGPLTFLKLFTFWVPNFNWLARKKN